MTQRKSDRKQQRQLENNEFERFDKGHFNFNRFEPLTPRQDSLFKAIKMNPMVVAIGPAGTAKSYTAAAAAISLLNSGQVDGIILTRNPVPTGYTTGLKPGTTEEKMAPWLAPILDNLRQACTSPDGNSGFFTYLLKNKKIEFQELETMKGANFKNKFVILEEGQEASLEQLKNISTRCVDGSWLYIDGDVAQGNSRLKNGQDFATFITSIRSMNKKLDAGTVTMSEEDAEDWGSMRVPVIEFDKNDCVRGGHCRWMLEMFETEGL
ncbi:MAG: PhoH family protein [Aeromonas popoffii]|uniref:PhoH family protein n=1 Tax=Aeromonas popoffii TaxID=70856 RepID=UPI003F39D819